MLWKPGTILPPEKLTQGIIASIMASLNPAQVLALTAWAEARSRFDGRKWVANPIDAMGDIVNIVQNRNTVKPAIGLRGHCLAKAQFSCWAPLQGQANFHTLMERSQMLLAGTMPSGKLLGCLALAEGCLAGSMVDSLSGATHYYSPASMVPPGRVPPWALPPAVLVDERHGHRFYNKVRW